MLLDKGGMPKPEQLEAMGMDEATARGIQSLVLLSKEDSPAAVKAMIDATAPEMQVEALQNADAAAVLEDMSPLALNDADNPTGNKTANADDANNDWDVETYTDISGPIIRDGSHMEDGKLKPNVTYQTGEHEYLYQTNENGLIVRAVAKVLRRKIHDGRLPHNPKTYGKEPGDHAGHLFADWFGGSPELDNLVSQAAEVNTKKYYALEQEWVEALGKGYKVSVNIDITCTGDKTRPDSFVVRYTIGGNKYSQTIPNQEDIL